MENRQGSWRTLKSPPRNLIIEVSSIFLFAFSVFILLSLFTYSPQDPSFLNNLPGPARNACGRAGAQLATLILQGFGIGGFLLPGAIFFMAAIIYKREGWPRLWGTLGGMTLAVASFTVFLNLQWKYWPFRETLLLTGGIFGVWVAEILLHEFNPMGSSLVSLLIFFIALAFSTPIGVARYGALVLSSLGKISLRLGKVISCGLFYLSGVVILYLVRSTAEGTRWLAESALHWFKSMCTSMFKSMKEKVDPMPPDWIESSLPQQKTDFLAHEPLKEPLILPYEGPHEKKTVTKSASRLVSSRVQGSTWKLPTIEFLYKPPLIESSVDRERLIANSEILRQKFADFGIDGKVEAVRPGPVITLYEFRPGPGVKVSRIAALADDLSMALSAQSVRILAPLPGKSVVGIEIPSEIREIVYLREFLQHPDFYGSKHFIPVVMGKDIGGMTYLSDLARMPHLLCAGQTGAGKSVFMNSLICSLFYRFTPDELRMILVDPKFIEFRAYQDIPHLLLPVVDDAKQASIALKWAVREMERRYRILAKLGVRNLASFNQKVDEMGADVVRDLLFSEENQMEALPASSGMSSTGADWMEAFEPDEKGALRVGRLPFIVIIIDELADLMMIARKEVEISIARLAQKARAAGLHLVIATQRPSTDVITGLIKANLPSRVSFQLASYVDSKTILDRAGAERLLGQGDMLFIPPGVSQVLRLHGALVEDEEINKITTFLKSQGRPIYRDEILIEEEDLDEDFSEGELDEKLEEAVELVKRAGHASASFLQRHLKIGYNRAARMIEIMETKGVVGPADGARPREVLLSKY